MPKSKKKTTTKAHGQREHREETIEDCSASLASYSSLSDNETPGEMAEAENDETASLQTILRELRASRQENENNFNGLKEELKNITGRVTEVEQRVIEVDDRTQQVEEVTLEPIKEQEKLSAKLTELEGRSRRENLRFHGIPEGKEDGSSSASAFIEGLLKQKLTFPTSLDLRIERAHHSLGPKPPPDAPPRSMIVKFSSYRAKEEVLKLIWQMKGLNLDGKKVIVDHDYAPDVLKLRREYTEAKRILREKKIKFQTPYPAKMRVFYDGEICVYNNASEATKDMVKRGFVVPIVKPPTSWADKIRGAMWRRADPADKRAPRKDGGDAGFKKKLEAFRRK